MSHLSEFEELWKNTHPYQSKREVFLLWLLVKKLQPKTMMEIGVSHGGTAKIWANAAPDARLFLVDMPGFPGNCGYTVREGKETVFYDSTSEDTIKVVKLKLGADNLDFLYIDGDHGYNAVRSDYLIYGPLVRKGIIALHDVTNVGAEGVHKFWEELVMNDDSEDCHILVTFPRAEAPGVRPARCGNGIVFRNIDPLDIL